MKVRITAAARWTGKFSAALMFEDSRAPLGHIKTAATSYLLTVADEEGFRGQYRKTILMRGDHGRQRLLLAGLGKRQDYSPERVRIAMAKLIKLAESLAVEELGLTVPDPKVRGGRDRFLAAAVEGAILADYRYTEHRKVDPETERPLGTLSLLFGPGQAATTTERRAVSGAQVIAEAVCYTRDLVNEPPSQKTPEMMAELATWLAKKNRISVKVMRKADLVQLGMNGILRVGAGSHEPPCLVHLTYQPRRKSHRTVCVIGKGVTFDAGGLSLKPANSMGTMKSDMAGAAAVLGLFRFLANTNVSATIHGLVPLAENLPGGGAQKPGDIIRHYNGTTVEVLNTDAEGRLLLADALAYGSTLKPDLMIDMATLTGACVIALGDECAALLGTDQKTINALTSVGRDQGELFWQLPLFDGYRSHLKSKVADIKNIGKPRVAGTIAAGLFLQEFVDKSIPWVHVDIAGPAFTEEGRPYVRHGATGFPLRTLAAFLREL